MEVNVRANVKISYLTKLPEYLRAYDYAVLANEASAMRGAQPIYDDIELKAIQYHLDPDFYPDVNWQVEVYVQTHSVSVVVHILDVLAVFVLLVDCRFI